MRIRSVKPEFWRDRALAGLSADARLFYIGLWMEADDAGWLRWDLAEIGADLYPYRPAHSRERQLVNYSEALIALPGAARLVILACGHAQITRLTGHQRASGKPVTTIYRQHANGCAGLALPGPGPNAKAAAVEHGPDGSPRVASGSPREPAVAMREPDTGGEVRGGVPTERVGRGGVEGKPTNGADQTSAVDAALALLRDPKTNEGGRHGARRTLERHAPQLLVEFDAMKAAPPPAVATARPRGASGG